MCSCRIQDLFIPCQRIPLRWEVGPYRVRRWETKGRGWGLHQTSHSTRRSQLAVKRPLLPVFFRRLAPASLFSPSTSRLVSQSLPFPSLCKVVQFLLAFISPKDPSSTRFSRPLKSAENGQEQIIFLSRVHKFSDLLLNFQFCSGDVCRFVKKP